MKSDIENFKCLFQIKDDGGIRGNCTCVQLIAINRKFSNCKITVVSLGFRKGKTDILSHQLKGMQILVIGSLTRSLQSTENQGFCNRTHKQTDR